MRPESKKRLEEFIKRADYIRSLSYFNNGDRIVGGSIKEVDGKTKITFFQPNDEKRDALLLNIRLFVQDKDDISIRRMAELYNDPEISDAWKKEHNFERELLNLRLSQIAAEGPKGTLTFDDIFRMFLFGGIAHFNQDDNTYKQFQKWVTDNTEWEILHNSFHEILIWVARAIINISVASKEELQRSK